MPVIASTSSLKFFSYDNVYEGIMLLGFPFCSFVRFFQSDIVTMISHEQF